ncbi:winged helix-turn-helix domain-containing protein [Nocardia rhizosphaerihabitans]|uniref:winged helix-turn-helix domain-containing protein n=1 Tax=Nocardia rhizosphaerihabitans TaxID=1691570 RepID=UPI00366B6510
MIADRRRLDASEIEALINAGLTQAEIAAKEGVSRQAVNWHLAQRGKTGKAFNPRSAHFPFDVPVEQQQNIYKRLRDHAEFMYTDGKGMSEVKLTGLHNWHRRLREEKIVVEFDPTLPPVRGLSKTGGWAYRPRTEADGNLLIRVNEYTNLTDQGREIFILPPEKKEEVP